MGDRLVSLLFLVPAVRGGRPTVGVAHCMEADADKAAHKLVCDHGALHVHQVMRRLRRDEVVVWCSLNRRHLLDHGVIVDFPGIVRTWARAEWLDGEVA